MSKVRFEDFKIRGTRVGASSRFPALRELIKTEISAKLDEDDGLFIGFGMMADELPYTRQDDYDTPEEELTFKAAVLENRYLKAVFLPELGGRLWSLYDKEHQRDLLLENTRLIPCNLAIRNAWFAGGVEFNCGRRGHDEQTMSPRFAAVVDTPEYQVLRIYEFQRDRLTPFQYDCFLPDDSRFLYIRCRIFNPNQYMVPMYWWSNIALPEVKGSRVVVPATHAFANWYSSGKHALAKIALPHHGGFDTTYPENFQFVRDHFFDIPADHRRYECLFYPDGYGFCHVSTRRLHGRKLFVWGQSQGGRHWNRKLLGPGLDAYIEIQGGLARTQQECLPMPPLTAWEWLEGYGAVVMDKKAVHGEWNDAVKNTTAVLDKVIPEFELEELLRNTRESVALKKGEVVIKGSGWGALEEKRTGVPLAEQLDFGEVGEEQQSWCQLLEKSVISGGSVNSFMVSDEWFELLKTAAPSWQVLYHIAVNYYRRNDLERAEKYLIDAVAICRNAHLLHLAANIYRRQQRKDEAAAAIFEAAVLEIGDASLVKEALKMLLSLEKYAMLFDLIGKLPDGMAELPLIRMMKSFALAYTGKLDEAEEILTGSGEWEIPDIREGENSTSQLYIYIQTKRAELNGQSLDPDKVDVPFHLDLRMSER